MRTDHFATLSGYTRLVNLRMSVLLLATIRATTLGAGLLLTVFKVAVAAALVAVILLSQPGEEPVAVRPPDTSPLVHPVL